MENCKYYEKCFAYLTIKGESGVVHKCAALGKLYCEKEARHCPFYQTSADRKANAEKAEKRLAELGSSERSYIMRKYGKILRES